MKIKNTWLVLDDHHLTTLMETEEGKFFLDGRHHSTGDSTGLSEINKTFADSLIQKTIKNYR